jgi:hypothetical protein
MYEKGLKQYVDSGGNLEITSLKKMDIKSFI